MDHKPSWLVLAFLVFLMSFLLSLNGIVIMLFSKYEQVHPITFLVFRNVGGSLVLFLFAWQAKQYIRISAKCLQPLLLCGFLLYLNQLCFLVGLYHTNPPISIMFQQLVPPLVTFLGVKIGLEKELNLASLCTCASPFSTSGKRRFWGMVFSLVGALWLISYKFLEEEEKDPNEESKGSKMDFIFGEFLFMVNSLAFALYLVLQKFVFLSKQATGKDEEMGDIVVEEEDAVKHQQFSTLLNSFCDFSEMPNVFSERPILFIAWVYCMSGVFYLLTAICLVAATGTKFLMFSTMSIPPILYGAIITTGVCYGIMSYCSKYLSPSVVSSFLPLEVALSCILSAAILGTRLAGQEYAGCGVIVFGLILVSRK